MGLRFDQSCDSIGRKFSEVFPMKIELTKWLRFGLALTMIGLTWCVILPAIASQPMVGEHIAHQKRLGIDPSALFYTELEVTPGIVNHMERMNESHADLFWGRTPKPDSPSTTSTTDK